ncbi:hypothetical protein [Crassaminicella indica]|uniref:Uncharacterized protein n=1 Tax=Crassaminicella indica TaxID=2855394 RepID=A0ABX8RC03_9CLOT|nr:hypothetical protein [Crassaminicella indica]QXM05245.1 hypothetical protein KVH43_07520 [Crassaminicella indica]
MSKIFQINKRNKGLILAYVLILSMVLLGYLFMVAMRADGYQPEIYEKGYMYFIILAFLLSTMLLSLWEIKEKDVWKGLFDVFIFTISAVPLILMIFMVGQISRQDILFPLLFQILWGVTIFSIKNLFRDLNIHNTGKAFLLIIFNFFILILSMIYLYFYSQYANLVITTVFDKDIPSIFLLNPLISLIGYLNEQIGGSNQMGRLPIIICFVFWGIFSSSIFYVSNKIKRHQGV